MPDAPSLHALLEEHERRVDRALRQGLPLAPSATIWSAAGLQRHPLSALGLTLEPQGRPALIGWLAAACSADATVVLAWEQFAVADPAEAPQAAAWLALGRRLASFHARQPALVVCAWRRQQFQRRVRRIIRARSATTLGALLDPETLVADPPLPDALP